MLNVGSFKEINDLMQRGILKDKGTGLEYYTGYEYETLYDWDQYFETILQIHMGWDLKYAKNGVIIFLENQFENGFISRTVPIRINGGEDNEHVKPFLAQICLLIYNEENNINFITEKYYQGLKKYLNYWIFNLDKDKTNLSVWNSAPHTGMDNQHERAGWWLDCFCQGVDLNSYLVRECRAFSKIAKILGKEEDCIFYEEHSNKIKDAIQKYLWDDEDEFFYDRNLKTGELLKFKYSAAFSVLWANVATAQQAEKIITKYLIDTKYFWRNFPISAYSYDVSGYSELLLQNDLGCNWRANTWIPVNYYVYHGLKEYKYNELAKKLATITFNKVNEIGPREYYTSDSCKGCGLDPFWGWSLLGYFMLEEEKSGIDLTKIK